MGSEDFFSNILTAINNHRNVIDTKYYEKYIKIKTDIKKGNS